MQNRRQALAKAAFAAASLSPLATAAQVQAAAPAQAPQPSAQRLYAVEFRTGPKWVASKPAPEQAHFRDHSANLRTLREQGSLVVGARYGDKGLVVLSAESETAARAMVEQDPSVKAGVFAYEMNEFSVFYGGSLQPRPGRT